MSLQVRRMNTQDHIAELLCFSSGTQGEASDNTKQYYKVRHKSALWTTFAVAHITIHLVCAS